MYNLFKGLLVGVVLMWVIQSCDQGAEFTPDGYNKTYTVQYHIYDTSEGVAAKFDRLTKADNGITNRTGDGYAMQGFSYNTSDGVCHIVLANPNTMSLKDYQGLIGHEHLHCMFGRWHGNNTNYPARINYDFNRVGINDG